MATLTVFPQSIGANNPVSGYAGRDGDEAFSSLRTNGGTTFSNSGFDPRLDASGTSNQYGTIRRAISCFDTSALTASATITAATISFLSNIKSNGLGSPDIHVAGATPASTTTLANADYLNVQTTSFGSIAYASIVSDSATLNTITLDANGIANINKTGISKFSFQTNWDINNSLTGVTWASFAFARVSMINDTTTSPKLVITYTTTPASTSNFFQMFSGPQPQQ